MVYFQVFNWMQTKMQVATDESYQDQMNLQGKSQKHQTFEAELETNQRRMQAVIDVRAAK